MLRDAEAVREIVVEPAELDSGGFEALAVALLHLGELQLGDRTILERVASILRGGFRIRRREFGSPRPLEVRELGRFDIGWYTCAATSQGYRE
ncbi:hypothetical protein GCM10009857_35760 [Agromyces soli]